MKRFLALLVLGMAFAATSQAQSQAPAKAASELAPGEVRKVDKAAGKLTIKHGRLANLDMPPMTMSFRVKDAGMLENVKSGDKVEFRAEKVAGQYTVTELRPAR